MARIDSHHHVWRYSPREYGWIGDGMEVLRRDFLPDDLKAEAAKAGVIATIAVQGRQSLEETEWLLELASQGSLVRGVVGWAPLADDNFPAILDQLCQAPFLRGLRHIVQAEPEGFLDGAAFNRGISALRNTGLVYDILIFARQITEATRFVDRHPNQIFVLDHIAKPDIVHHGFDVWKKAICELARRENVTCKLSGMVTEADWKQWSPTQLQPYFETVLEAFGPSRLMAGSDWPVLLLAGNYAQWWQIVSEWIAPLSATERSMIEAETAARIYGLRLQDGVES